MVLLITRPLWAMVYGFASLGAVASVLMSRQPEFFLRWALTNADWGWVLFAAGLGGVLAYPLNRWLLVRWGSRRMLSRFGTAGGATMALVPWLPGHAGLLAGIFLQGMLFSGAGVAINHQAAEFEARRGRRVMGRLHATYFAGSVASAVTSSLLAALDVGLAAHMATIGLLLAWLHRSAAASLEAVATASPLSIDAGAPLPACARGLGLLLGWCTVLESGVMGWASVFLNRQLEADESMSGLGLAVFSGAMAMGRLFSDRLVAHFGPARLVRGGALLCACSMALAASLQWLPVALLAFAAAGLGLAAAAPTIYSAAGRTSTETLAFVAGMGAIGALFGPLLLGRVATLASLGWVLGALAVVSLLVAWQARVLGGRDVTPTGLLPAVP